MIVNTTADSEPTMVMVHFMASFLLCSMAAFSSFTYWSIFMVRSVVLSRMVCAKGPPPPQGVHSHSHRQQRVSACELRALQQQARYT